MANQGRITLTIAGFLLLALLHHEVLGKFDDKKPMTLNGVVTSVEWKNPHAHLMMNVRSATGVVNWAIELESTNDLERSGWTRESAKPGDAVRVDGIAARDGSPQVWARSVVLTSTGKKILDVRPATPPVVKQSQPTPLWPDGKPRLGPPPGGTGYWAYPSAVSLVQQGTTVPMDANGLLRNIGDVDKVAPFQRWARDLYELRQRNFLRDDPMFLYCIPPGGPRQYQLPYGLQFVEDRNFQRIFVLIGSGNRNFRMINTDGRALTGQLAGDADNPL